jgi:uncharacterized membrane protein (UPF0182 family)
VELAVLRIMRDYLFSYFFFFLLYNMLFIYLLKSVQKKTNILISFNNFPFKKKINKLFLILIDTDFC